MGAFEALLELVRFAFTAPSFELFGALLYGWICAPGRRTITGIYAVGDPHQRRAHDAYHRLVREGAWSLRWLWRALAVHLVAQLCPEGTIWLDLDDTLFRRSGAKVEGAGIFRDPVRSTAKSVVYALGLNLVVVTLRVRPPWGGPPIGLPVNVRLHRKGDQITFVEHAVAMLQELVRWLPGRQFHVCADGAYVSLSGKLPPGVHLTSRMRRDAALFGPPPPRTGRRGRPRLRGERLPTPTQMAAATCDWRTAEFDCRGQRRERTFLVRDVLWYAVCPQALVRLSVVRDPDGIEPDDFFFSTELSLTGAEIAAAYAGRWSIEVCFRDTKQDLGGENPQCWKGSGPERAAGLAFWLHSFVWSWYLQVHPEGDAWAARSWYPRKSRPSFLDALAALRRVLWAQRITAISTREPHHSKITTALLDTLAYAA